MGEEFRETLYTIDKSGHRKWVYPNLVKGFWFKRRAILAYMLMAIYLLMPWITIDGMQGVLLDFANRKFTFFGATFWATDTIFLFLVLGLAGFSLFCFTALFGRVWCGWACPETVFLEFLFRPIERLIEGNGAKRLKLDQLPWSSWEKIKKKALKHALSAFFAWVLASTTLAYFVGRGPLLDMMTGSPLDHPVPFFMTLVLMGLMAFQFGWFREQFCTVVCPYARFQSTLLDANSLVVGYDPERGEPRGKPARSKGKELGDCVDCGLCLRVCPTGIDIRNGLQLECIHCTACIDACDSIMDKVGKPQGLIRYDTENNLLGTPTKILRPRVFVYSLVLLGLLGAFIYLLSTRELSDFRILRGRPDSPFEVLADGVISNYLQVRVSNKSDDDRLYTIRSFSKELELVTPITPFPVASGEMNTMQLFVKFPKKFLGGKGSKEVEFEIKDDAGYTDTQEFTLLGPGA